MLHLPPSLSCRYVNPGAIHPLLRRDAPENKDVQFLIHGHFCVHENASGCNDIRWVGVPQMLESGLDAVTIKDKVKEFNEGIEAASVAALEEALEKATVEDS